MFLEPNLFVLFYSDSCPPLTTSSSGTVQISTNGISTVANFTCATGYTRFGEQTFNCQADGTWDAAEPTCGKYHTYNEII